MKTTSPGLDAVMAKSQFLTAELYTFTLASGVVMRFGDYDPRHVTLVANGNSFPTSGLKFERTATTQNVGLQVSTLALKIYADQYDPTSYINGITHQQFARGGGFDGATCQIDRCFMDQWGDCAINGTMMWFYGRCADMTIGRTTVNMNVNSLVDLLACYMPRDVYQPGCLNTLYEPNTCRLAKAAFAQNGAIVANGDTLNIPTNFSLPVDYLTQGTIRFTSGVNNGVTRNIKSQTSNIVVLNYPLIAPPALGDTLTAFPGCNKTMATCIGKFNNLSNFRGQPNIPVPETSTP